MQYIVQFFSWIMDLCYQVVPNHWADIVIFTLITKILQYPLSLWCHVNSLKMVAIMPQSIRIKIDHYGDSDKIGEETAELFKREHYHPLLSLIPLAIQIVILMGFVKVIYGIAAAEKESLIGRIPVQDGGVAWVMPIIAGAAAWFLGWCQNRISPLQHEQTRAQQMTTNGISIAISLFLGCFVGMGVGLYWAASNLFSVLVQLCCNITIIPKKHIDYSSLRSAQEELRKLESSFTHKATKEERRREKADYRRFFNVANKHLVFYAEGGGYYKYFQSLIEWLLEHSNVVIHYVTNDPNDMMFERAKKNSHIRPYYIGQMKIIPLMMKMDADMVVMTSPDLGKYQIKRSYVRKDIEYIYLCHGPTSTHMCTRTGAYDNFDTIFVSGPFQIDEIRATERVYKLKEKNLVQTGYLFFDTLFNNVRSISRVQNERPRIMIAPSYQEDNILDSCVEQLILALADTKKNPVIVVRPHPQYIRRAPVKWQAVKDRCRRIKSSPASDFELVFEDDFSKPTTMNDSDVLVTDWSSIAYEFAFASKRPCLFVNTKMKVINPEYERIGIVPTDIWFRDEVGVSVAKGDWQKATMAVGKMVDHPDEFAARISDLLNKNFYHPGNSAETAGRYIINSLIEKKKGTAK